MNLNELRDDVRAYLRSKRHQEKLAQKLGVSYSWLNKFVNGQFPNLSPTRLQKLAEWVEMDRAASLHREPGEGFEGNSQRSVQAHDYTIAGQP